ncbi:MAG: hypothetical protein LBT66_08045 [Methanobrevibacter sp.]|jgi:hypothetical protein|nr:hypothetical protein [Candidatus Methanovirga meridionalis]
MNRNILFGIIVALLIGISTTNAATTNANSNGGLLTANINNNQILSGHYGGSNNYVNKSLFIYLNGALIGSNTGAFYFPVSTFNKVSAGSVFTDESGNYRVDLKTRLSGVIAYYATGYSDMENKSIVICGGFITDGLSSISITNTAYFGINYN